MPAPLAVSLAEACEHVRVDLGAEDAAVLALVRSAQTYVEDHTGCILTRRLLTSYVYDWPADGFDAVAFPAHSARVFYRDEDGTEIEVPAADITLRQGAQQLLTVKTVPTDAVQGGEIRIVIDCGFPEGLCPDDLKHACLLLVGHWYKHREQVVSGSVTDLPHAVPAIIAKYKRVWLA